MGEKPDVESLERPDAKLIHDVVRTEGASELERSTPALGWSGLAAGFSMGLSLFGEGVLRAGLPESSWRHLVTAFGYTLGFVVVVLGRQQLFTENTLTAVVPLLEEPGRRRLASVLRLWSVVLLANLAGTVAFAWFAARTGAFSPAARDAFLQIGVEALRPEFLPQLLKALVAGWIIALMVWLLPAMAAARILTIVTLTYFLSVGGLAHVIAGSAEVAYVVAAGEASWADYAGRFVLPALLGNIIGGVLFVAVLNHMQVRGSPGPEDA